ncbi:C6 transcription factor-like protein [Lophiostoma macrostomum CBS 122681]|uniref:C6 transcription factor-like protein n=1 Tax=Lophiostoma macrostomum CBS 122681 TaxID=1314788 RepID=A0A6A6TP38_9PLEO|nr:C6 transcription factor-like protein [Lophiostoma macrostomum CBS 122681]
MSSQRSNSMEASQDNIRKRVCKACDRCRLKKSKCDGASPCSRCKADNAICVFGERKKSQDKVYPKGYVEMLEQQQTQLVAGLRDLYTRLQSGQSWPGQPLREAQGGHPLTHDILERLDLLHSTGESSSNYDGFEEDCNKMQQKLLENGAPYTHRRGSMSSNSDHGHTSSSGSSYGGTPTTKSIPYIDPFSRNKAPPTPPMNSPFPRQSQIVPQIKQETPMVSSTFMNTGALDPSALTRPAWSTEPMMMDEPMDFSTKSMYTFDSFTNFDSNAMMLDPCVISPANPMMPDWNDPNDLDFSSFIHNPVGA